MTKWISEKQDYVLYTIREEVKDTDMQQEMNDELGRIYQEKDWVAVKKLIGEFYQSGVQGLKNYLAFIKGK